MIYHEALDDAGRLLVLALRGQRSPDENDALRALHERLGDARCHEIARTNQVEPLVADALDRVVPEAELAPTWTALLSANRRRVRRLISALEAVGCRLARSGCAFAAVEAGGVLLGSDLPERAYAPGDIDLLVAQQSWELAQRCLAAEGFAAQDRRGRPTSRLEFCRTLDDGTVQWLEAGFAPFDRMWVPLRLHDRCALWLERRRPARKASSLSVLDPSDALVFVCMHTSLHSYLRAPGIRLHVDADRLIHDNPIDWQRVVDEIEALGVPSRAFVSLAMAAGLLGTPVPEEVLQRLCPPGWRWSAISGLLRGEGIVADGRPKLRRAKAVVLDLLLDDDGPWRWLHDVLLPPTPWLQEHFDRDKDFGWPPQLLHLRRAWRLASRWRPE